MFQRSCRFFGPGRPRTRPDKTVRPPRVATYSKYQCFVVEASKLPEIRSLKTFAERGMTTAHLWRNMTEKEKKRYEEMSKRSKAISASQRRTGIVKPGWKMFVKKNMHKVKFFPLTERLQVLSKQWRLMRARDPVPRK